MPLPKRSRMSLEGLERSSYTTVIAGRETVPQKTALPDIPAKRAAEQPAEKQTKVAKVNPVHFSVEEVLTDIGRCLAHTPQETKTAVKSQAQTLLCNVKSLLPGENKALRRRPV